MADPSEWTFAKSTFRPSRKPGAPLYQDTSCSNMFQVFETTSDDDALLLVGNGMQPKISEVLPVLHNRNIISKWNDAESAVSDSVVYVGPGLFEAGPAQQGLSPAIQVPRFTRRMSACDSSVPSVPVLSASQV